MCICWERSTPTSTRKHRFTRWIVILFVESRIAARVRLTWNSKRRLEFQAISQITNCWNSKRRSEFQPVEGIERTESRVIESRICWNSDHRLEFQQYLEFQVIVIILSRIVVCAIMFSKGYYSIAFLTRESDARSFAPKKLPGGIAFY